MTIESFGPDTQLALAQRLAEIDALHLAPALTKAVEELDIAALDDELARLVEPDRLGRVAALGLRGERLFPTPLVLEQDPRLLAYYRLLYGLSQKTFYRSLGRFKSMEERGKVSPRARSDLDELCESLCETGWLLFEGLDATYRRQDT